MSKTNREKQSNHPVSKNHIDPTVFRHHPTAVNAVPPSWTPFVGQRASLTLTFPPNGGNKAEYLILWRGNVRANGLLGITEIELKYK